jgi:glycosyltransferase involved in cell wall biosynthesis
VILSLTTSLNFTTSLYVNLLAMLQTYSAFTLNQRPATSPAFCQEDCHDLFIVGHFSRFSPWKGQHVLIQSLTYCPQDVVVLLVGEALFGEAGYEEQLHQQIRDLSLTDRIKFLGFQSNVYPVMQACNLVVHTSIAPEPFGRVIVEGMLCGRPVVATAAGGATEIIEHGKTGWLCPPDNAHALAEAIMTCRNNPQQTQAIAAQGQIMAQQRFNLKIVQQQMDRLLSEVVDKSRQ